MDEGRYSRNEGLIGAEGQAKIAATSVAIVGLGGLGSHVVQQLAYLGVRIFTLVDHDVVTESSLNRLVGALESDMPEETLKVHVAMRTIKGIASTSQVQPLEHRLADPKAREAIAVADIVIGCLDHDRDRIELLEICSRNARPYFDLATDVLGEEHDIYGGRVVFCDGSRCLVCLPEIIDQRDLAFSGLSGEHREADGRIYGIDRGALSGTGPSVVSINGVVASLGVTEFMAHVTDLRLAAGQLTYRADKGIVTRSSDLGDSGCYYCSGLWSGASK